MDDKKSVQVCPVCGSENFNVYKGDKFLEQVGGVNYICKKCGNVFPLPLEVFDGDVKQIEKKLEETRAREKMIEDTPNEMVAPYGFFLVRFWLLILGVLWILLGLGILFGAVEFEPFPYYGILLIAGGILSLLIFFLRRKKA